jgi:hypothetical protein
VFVRVCAAVVFREGSVANKGAYLVGPPGFEPRTSCTPSGRLLSTGRMWLGGFYGLHGFGASASAHRRWPNSNLWHIFLHTGSDGQARLLANIGVGGKDGLGRPLLPSTTLPYAAEKF